MFGYAFAGTYSPTNAGFVQLEQKDAPGPPEGTFGSAFARTYSPASAGFVQLNESEGSACANSGVMDVTCVPNEQLWAEGMKGDENLNEAVTIKNDGGFGGQ